MCVFTTNNTNLHPLFAELFPVPTPVSTTQSNCESPTSYVHTPVRFTSENPFTIEAWIEIHGNENNTGTVIADNQGAGLGLGANPTYAKAQYLTTKRVSTGWGYHIVQSGPLPSREMVHLASVYDGQQLTLFVNGELSGSKLVEGEFVPSYLDTLIGANPNDTTIPEYYFHGVIDEVRMSSIARYSQEFTPDKRYDKDEHTIALYHFDEGAGDIVKDDSGNGHDGIIFDASWFNPMTRDLKAAIPEAQTDAASRTHNYALSFDGKTDHVRTPINFDKLRPFTIEALVTRPRNWKHGPIVSNTHHSGLGLTLQPDSAQFILMQDKPYSKYLEVVSDSLPEASTIHVAGVYDGSSLHIYVEGRLKNTTKLEGNFIPSKLPLQIGGSPDGTRVPDFAFGGMIDEVRISETVRYKSKFDPPDRHEPDEHTLALYHFDEGRSDILKDSSGNGHDGKIIGAKWIKVDETLGATSLSSTSADAPPPAIAPFDAVKAKAHQEAWAKHLGTTVETTNSIGAKMILIPPGEFMIGSSDADIEQITAIVKERGGANKQWIPRQATEAETPQHHVTLTKPFLLAATEVTIAQFRRFVEETRYQTDAERDGFGNSNPQDKGIYWLNPGYEISDDQPVSQVSPKDALAYCDWLSKKENAVYGLPTEAEWEFACRAGTATPYYFGDDDSKYAAYEWCSTNARGKPQPVATKQPNPFGLFDMQGNLSEYCADIYVRFAYASRPASVVDPIGTGPGTAARAQRGQSWLSSPLELRSAFRYGAGSTSRYMATGFRVARRWNTTPPPAVAPFDAATAKQHQQAWAKHLGVPVEFTNSIGMTFVLIPPGEFMMGAGEKKNGSTATDLRRVRVASPFYVGTTEVTRENYDALLNDERSQNSSSSLRLPIANVSWFDAVNYANILSKKEGRNPEYDANFAISGGPGYRLPTEEEWEFAVRGGTTTAHYFGEAGELPDHAWISLNSNANSHPVQEKLPNPFGLFDVYGNVWEWCNDARGKNLRVYRGGAYDEPVKTSDIGEYPLNNSYARPQYDLSATRKDPRIGFRLMLSIDVVKLTPGVTARSPGRANAPPHAVCPVRLGHGEGAQEAWAKHLSLPVEYTTSYVKIPN